MTHHRESVVSVAMGRSSPSTRPCRVAAQCLSHTRKTYQLALLSPVPCPTPTEWEPQSVADSNSPDLAKDAEAADQLDPFPPTTAVPALGSSAPPPLRASPSPACCPTRGATRVPPHAANTPFEAPHHTVWPVLPLLPSPPHATHASQGPHGCALPARSAHTPACPMLTRSVRDTRPCDTQTHRHPPCLPPALPSHTQSPAAHQRTVPPASAACAPGLRLPSSSGMEPHSVRPLPSPGWARWKSPC